MTIHKLQREILDCYWLQLSNRTKKILKAHDVRSEYQAVKFLDKYMSTF